ncbi:MAG TPA: pyridoxamine 5'-phosphate oxidase family protein, partial [Gaiellaceae bacterium]|nr:pyridoxamine 5'-phosphate oxidase family protein [Gaiellaceae bacterium]
HVGLLFIDFEKRTRLRMNGVAEHLHEHPLLADWPEAQFLWRIRATEIFPNCPRYIHHYTLVERSRFVPKAACRTPVPAWKRREWASDALAVDDPAYADDADVIER